MEWVYDGLMYILINYKVFFLAVLLHIRVKNYAKIKPVQRTGWITNATFNYFGAFNNF